MKTIMQVLPSLKQGGVETGTIEIATALTQAKIPNIVVSAGGPMVAQLTKLGVKHFTLPVDTKNPILMWRNVKKLVRIARSNDVGLMHVRSRAPAWTVKWASRRTGIPFISSFHGIYGIKPAIKKFYNKAMLTGEGTIAVSNCVKEHLMDVYHYPADKIRVINRGADLNRFDPDKASLDKVMAFAKEHQIPMDKPVITMVARLTKPKGQLELLRAIKQMKHTELTCLLIGGKAKPQYEDELKQEIAELPDTVCVRTLSVPADKIPMVYTLSDVVVSASLIPEAFGRTIAEANAMNKIVVAFNHGGPTETIIDGKTGFLTPVGDVVALAKTLDKVLDMSPTEKKRMEAAARDNAVNRFSIQLMCNKTIDFYKEILK